MGHNRIKELFFENPTKDFQIRGIAKTLSIPKTTVSYQINKLLEQSIIIKEKKSVFPSFRANETNKIYRFYKKQSILQKIHESGLLDYLETECNPRCTILFGSVSKAEYDKNSDIDLFLQTKEIKINVEKYEKKLKHNINLIFEYNLNNISKELLNNIINGDKLQGFIKIK